MSTTVQPELHKSDSDSRLCCRILSEKTYAEIVSPDGEIGRSPIAHDLINSPLGNLTVNPVCGVMFFRILLSDFRIRVSVDPKSAITRFAEFNLVERETFLFSNLGIKIEEGVNLTF